MKKFRISKFNAALFFMLFALLALNADAQEAPWVGESLDGNVCTGGSPGNFGPYDYRRDKQHLPVVENRHFTSRVEQLQGGQTTLHAIGDISYTLVRFPNHHRALYSAVRFSLGESGGGERSRYPAECFLQRAIFFSPADSVPYMLYGLYLHQLGQLEESLEKYQAAEMLVPNDANLLYNMGLANFDSGNFTESQRYAVKAYSLGMTFPGLQRKLLEAGYWE